MNLRANSNHLLSPNEERYRRLETIGNSVAPLYSDARNSSNLEEFDSVCANLRSIADSTRTVASEFSELLYITLDSCESKGSLDDKKQCFRDGLETAKQWLYDQKRDLGVMSPNAEPILIEGKLAYRNGVFTYDGRALNLANLPRRLLREFLESSDKSLTKDRISTLGGVPVADSAKRRIYVLKQKLSGAGVKGDIFKYDSYAEKYTLIVE